jgi:hypothetical protein
MMSSAADRPKRKIWRTGAQITVTYVRDPEPTEDAEYHRAELKRLIIDAAILRTIKLRAAKLPQPSD